MTILYKNILYMSFVSLSMFLTACGDTAASTEVVVSSEGSRIDTSAGTQRDTEAETTVQRDAKEETETTVQTDTEAETTVEAEAEVQVEKATQERYAGWYMRIRANATAVDGTVFSHNSAGVFGKLVQSKDMQDRHDIAAYDTDVFQVVFPQYDWDEQSGDYWSDYRAWEADKSDARLVYTFLIRNQKDVDLSNASLELFIDAAQNVNYIEEKDGNIKYIETNKDAKKLDDFTLVDVDNNQTYDMDELEYANLSMDGKHTRTFRIVRGKVEKIDYEQEVLIPEKSQSIEELTSESSKKELVGGAEVEWIEPDTLAVETKFGLPPQ